MCGRPNAPIVGPLTSSFKFGSDCAHCRAHGQPCAKHSIGQAPLATNWPVRLIGLDDNAPPAPPPCVAHAQMAIRRQRASRWLRERAKRKGMKGLIAALKAVA